MGRISRRDLLKIAGAGAGGAVLMKIAGGNLAFAGKTEAAGYFEREFGITDSLCGEVLGRALSRGGDFADLYFEHTLENYIGLEDGKVDRAYGSVALGAGVRCVKGDQTGYAYTQTLDRKSMLAAAETAASIAAAGPLAPARAFIPGPKNDFYPAEQLLNDAPVASRLALLKAIHEKAFSLSKLIVKTTAGFSGSDKRILVVASDGVKAEDFRPQGYLNAGVVAEKGGRRERAGWAFGGLRGFEAYTKEKAEAVAKGAVDRVLVLFDAIQPPAGEMPVVLGPDMNGVFLHEAIGHGMEADFNRKKISVYTDMIGKKVAEPFVTIVDDATLPGLSGSLNADDEGAAGRRTVLVENGTLRGFLHDRISSRFYGVPLTGNGRRQSYEHYPMPRMRNTYLLAGAATAGDVIRSVKKGLYVQEVSNGQVKIGEGDFAFYVSQGRMIEDGKLTAPVKDVNIMGNGPKTLRNIVMVGNDLKMNECGVSQCGKNGQSAPVSFGIPTCLVKSMTVGGVKKQGA